MSNPPRRLFLHLGPAKTGTSAVQAVFRDLDDPRLTYPKTGQWPDGSHNLLSFALKGWETRGTAKIPELDTLLPAITEELNAAQTDALISSEMLCNPKTYAALHHHLADPIAGFDQVIPLITLRHPIERAASAYNQQVKDAHFGLASLPDDFLTAKTRDFLIVPFMQQWSGLADNIVFLPYHPQHTFVSRFCTAIERPDLAPDDPGQANRSLSGKGLALLLLGNRNLPDATTRARFFNEVVRGTKELKIWQGPSFPFSTAAVDHAMASAVALDLARAREAFGVDLTDWTPPEAIALSELDAEMVATVAREYLLGKDLEADMARVLACFSDDAQS
ncbi:MAG: hypothetical protein AAF382_12725 [Pseudomonadota bacterium]